jgi:2'-hydroxyisoflavone reductase
VRGEEAGGSLTGIKRSIAEGLRSRALDETVRDTLAWHETRPPERKATLRSGLAPEREAELLAAWHARK